MSPWKRSGLYIALAARGMAGEAATAATAVARSIRRSLRKYTLPLFCDPDVDFENNIPKHHHKPTNHQKSYQCGF
ncbi:hypothetical protein E2C01_007378 [Portunus trituberculatus]|uniref:Uncharacterized protein n=1 Tax=Portunus trituberculatus TaxID=210409 RepID=A0A5B7CYV9_PORTR|nr:hypothetical protein [Portunus trituberculatus]